MASKGDSLASDVGKTYVYSHEIAQMIFVFVEISDPADEVLKLIEDIVQAQCVELLVQARKLAIRRNSKFLASEDLIFLIRHDRPKVNRLRTYLSWKDVRKNAKDSGDAGAPGGGGPEMDGLDDGAVEGAKSQLVKLRLPWELSTMYTENLRSLVNEEAEEDDEEDVEAQEASLKRLREADEATRRMTREEYVHYSECRQASFTWRKSKRFREFINAGAYIDVKPNDDILDILGFLAYEVVRELCIKAVAIRDAEEERSNARKNQPRRKAQTQTTLPVTDSSDTSADSIEKSLPIASTNGDSEGRMDHLAVNPRKRKMTLESSDRVHRTPSKRVHLGPAAVNSGESPNAANTVDADQERAPKEERDRVTEANLDGELCSLFTMPPSKHVPLTPAHIQEAFARVQRGNAAMVSGGMPHQPGGLRRTRLFVI